jgi:DNA polymerase-3 subunit delta'
MLFNKIIGQDQVKRILTTLFEQKHFPPLLFVGPKGVGKRTTAINFAQIINCPEQSDIIQNQCQRCQQIGNLTHPDIKMLFPIPTGISSESDETKILQEVGNNLQSYALGQIKPPIPSTSLIPIRMIRWIKQEMAFKPMVSRYKIIIILNIEKMNQEAANAFLKTLEEPQQETVFILTTERIFSLLPTIRSRCQTIRFSSIDYGLIMQYLIMHKNISEPEAKLAATIAEGSLRKALDYLFNQETFLPHQELVKLLDRTQISSLESLKTITDMEYDTINPEKIISHFIFIYRNALQSKLSIPCSYDTDIVKKITKTFSVEQITSKISYLLNVLRDTETHLNKKLFLFSILSKVRF